MDVNYKLNTNKNGKLLLNNNDNSMAMLKR